MSDIRNTGSTIPLVSIIPEVPDAKSEVSKPDEGKIAGMPVKHADPEAILAQTKLARRERSKSHGHREHSITPHERQTRVELHGPNKENNKPSDPNEKPAEKHMDDKNNDHHSRSKHTSPGSSKTQISFSRQGSDIPNREHGRNSTDHVKRHRIQSNSGRDLKNNSGESNIGLNSGISSLNSSRPSLVTNGNELRHSDDHSASIYGDLHLGAPHSDIPLQLNEVAPDSETKKSDSTSKTESMPLVFQISTKKPTEAHKKKAKACVSKLCKHFCDKRKFET
jgi:hypothetical protein